MHAAMTWVRVLSTCGCGDRPHSPQLPALSC